MNTWFNKEKKSWMDTLYADSRLIPSRKHRILTYITAGLFGCFGIVSVFTDELLWMGIALLFLALGLSVWSKAVTRYVLSKDPEKEVQNEFSIQPRQ